jgi:hypothetical protein
MIDASHSWRLSDTFEYRIVQLSSLSPSLSADSFLHHRRRYTTSEDMTSRIDRHWLTDATQPWLPA